MQSRMSELFSGIRPQSEMKYIYVNAFVIVKGFECHLGHLSPLRQMEQQL